MCVECGCEVPETEEEVHDGESVVHLPAEVAADRPDRSPLASNYDV